MTFKSGKFSWQGGRTDTAADRTAFVLKGVAQTLIGLGVGWELDTARNATVDNYTVMSGATASYLLYLKNVDGARLMVSYSYLGASGFAQSLGAGNNNVGGLIMSMIPPGEGEFGTNPAASNFLPAKATRLMGGCMGAGTSFYSLASTNSAGATYSYTLVSDGKRVAVFAGTGGTGLQAYAIGELFSALAHDKNVYGVLPLTYHVSAEATTDAMYGINQTGLFQDQMYYPMRGCIAVMDAEGNWKTASSPSSSDTPFLGADTELLSDAVGAARWVPLWLAVPVTTMGGIVDGDGLKGYIDPAFLRETALHAQGDLLNDGGFIYIGGRLAMGWDKDNTDSMF